MLRGAVILLIGWSLCWLVIPLSDGGEAAPAEPTPTKEATPESAKDKDVVRYKLPADEASAVHYSASWVIDQNLGGRYSGGTVRATAAIWAKGQDRACVRFVRHAGSVEVHGKKRGLSDKAVVGKMLEFTLPPRGAAKFKLDLPKDCPVDLKNIAEMFFDEMLPLLFMELPDNFEPKAGMSWGPKPPQEPNGYSNHPDLVSWRVKEVLPPSNGRSVALLESSALETFGKKSITWRSRTVQYDTAAKRVRSATETYRSDEELDEKTGLPRTYSHQDFVITEVPPPEDPKMFPPDEGKTDEKR